MVNKLLSLLFFTILSYTSFAQQVLTSWGQQTIENYTKEMYDEAQKLTTSELLSKNLADKSWGAVFVTLNASVNNYSNDTVYLTALANQITNNTETRLEGTSRLIIWDRIVNGDITFEGKGLVLNNDLFKVAGRANQLLQNLTSKDFGPVTMQSTMKELEVLKIKWINFLLNKPIEEYRPIEYKNAKIPEISSLAAVHALIVSLQDNPTKQSITKSCLKKLYQLDDMPKDKSAPANFCNPDTYTFSYIGILFGDKNFDETKNAKWWKNFWDTNHDKLVWNSESGIYEVAK